MFKNLKILAIISLALPMTSYAVTYSCPTLAPGNYISYKSKALNWHLYFVDSNYSTKTNFSLKNNVNWSVFFKDELPSINLNTTSILICSADYEGGYLNATAFVDHPNCTSNNNGIFTCQ